MDDTRINRSHRNSQRGTNTNVEALTHTHTLKHTHTYSHTHTFRVARTQNSTVFIDSFMLRKEVQRLNLIWRMWLLSFTSNEYEKQKQREREPNKKLTKTRQVELLIKSQTPVNFTLCSRSRLLSFPIHTLLTLVS